MGRTFAIYGGLMVTILIASLDQTIVATALPSVVSDLGGLGTYSWVFSVFLLTQAITIPLYGKFGDLYGRRRMLLIAVTIFVLSSALCGAAQSMTELVAFRALQGIGAGGLIPLTQAVIGEIVPPRDRGRYQGLIGAAFATAAVLGPAAGGLIVDHTTWRWIFYVNVPVGAFALAIIAVTMPRKRTRRDHAIDYPGTVLLAAGTALLMFSFVQAGDGSKHNPFELAAGCLIGILLLVVFVFVERRAAEPILPLSLLTDRMVLTGVIATFIAAVCMFGTVAFVPLFAQRVIGTSATSSGVVLTPMSFGTVAAAILSGQWVARTGMYRISALCGAGVLGIAMFLLSRLDVHATTGITARDMVLGGIGMGLLMNMLVIATQNAVPARIIGTATALLQFARALGTTIGVTLFGVIITRGLPRSIVLHRSSVHRLSPASRAALTHGTHSAFLLAAVACVAMFVVLWFGLEQRTLSRAVDSPVKPTATADAEA